MVSEEEAGVSTENPAAEVSDVATEAAAMAAAQGIPSVTTGSTASVARSWTCPKCKTESLIPLEVPADAVIQCPMCAHTGSLSARPAPVPPQRRRDRVAIVGFADSWPAAPYANPTWDIWCLNQFYDLCGGKVDLAKIGAEGRLTWFENHRRYDIENDPNVIARHPHHLQKLREMSWPVYMHQHWDDIPNSIEYPLAAMTARFGSYWTNSISYMMALAIAQGYREIGLYGVNMAQDEEHGYQRPSCEYFIGWARALGITVHIPPESDLLKCPYLYGYEDDKADAFLAKLAALRKDHEAKLTSHQAAAEQNGAIAQQFHGAIQQIDGIAKIYRVGR